MYKTLVSFDGSPSSIFFFSLFFPPPRFVGMFCRPVVQMGNFCWNCAEDNLGFLFLSFFFSKDTQISIVSLHFWHIFCSCFSPVVLQRWNLATFNLSHTMISLFGSQNHVSMPLSNPSSKWFAPGLFANSFFTQSPFAFS